MPGLLLLALCLLAPGSHRAGTASVPAKADPKDELTAAQRARKAVPVLNRTLTQNDLNQLLNYMNQYHAAHGKYPKSLAEMAELSVERDAPHIAKAIQSGEFVLAGGAGGVLAYEKATLDDRGSVIATSGVQTMTAAELREKLQSQ